MMSSGLSTKYCRSNLLSHSVHPIRRLTKTIYSPVGEGNVDYMVNTGSPDFFTVKETRFIFLDCFKMCAVFMVKADVFLHSWEPLYVLHFLAFQRRTTCILLMTFQHNRSQWNPLPRVSICFPYIKILSITFAHKGATWGWAPQSCGQASCRGPICLRTGSSI